MSVVERLPCSPAELGWLRDMEVIGTVREPYSDTFLGKLFGRRKEFPGKEQPRNAIERAHWDKVESHAAPYARQLPPNADIHFGRIGIAPLNAALISFTEALLIIPVADIDAIVIQTTTAGRSYPSGGLAVLARCQVGLVDLRCRKEDVGVRLAERLRLRVKRIELSGD